MAKIKAFVLLIKSKFSGLFAKFKSLSIKKKILVIILLLVVLGIIFSIIGNATKNPGYVLANVEKGSVSEVVSETGNILTSNRSDIYSPTNGIVTKIHVKNGDLVSRNQILFEVESTATEQEKSAASSNYLAAVSSVNSAKANADSLQSAMFSQWQSFKDTAESTEFENSDGTPRYEERSKSEFHIAEKNWTAAEKNYQNAQTAIAAAQANAASAKLQLDATKDAKVKAVVAGRVENMSVAEGSGVTITQVLSPVRPVLTLVGEAPTEVSVKLSESDIVKVDVGQKVDLDVSAVKDKNYKGVVVRVDRVGVDEQGVIRYTAYIQVNDPDNFLRQGMSVDADIQTEMAEDVLIVPNSAVKPYQGGRAVRVVGKGNEIEFIPVKVGIRGEKYTEIVEGIEEGQEVITALSNESIKRPGLF
jgi:RND family efflux transporter MFP subunit